MHVLDLGRLLRETYRQFTADKGPRLGAALAYYAVFSMAPLLLLALAIASIYYGPAAARGEIYEQLANAIGTHAAEAVQDVLGQTHLRGGTTLATLVSLIAALFGASGIFVQLQDALNTIWHVQPPLSRGPLQLLRERFFSFVAVLVLISLVVVSLVTGTVLNALSKRFDLSFLPGGSAAWQLANFVLTLCLLFVAFACLFKLLPDAHVRWRDTLLGAAMTAVLFTLGKHLVGLYLSWTTTASAFGAAGSMAVLLIWVYYSAQIVLFGATFTRVRSQRDGWQATPVRGATPIAGSQSP